MLDRLKQKNAGFVGSYEWDGTTIHLCRMTAKEWVRMQSILEAAAKEEIEGNKADATVDFYVEVLARTLCDESGVKDCDSDEGRAELRKLSMGDLASLGQLALKHNGAKDDDEKN